MSLKGKRTKQFYEIKHEGCNTILYILNATPPAGALTWCLSGGGCLNILVIHPIYAGSHVLTLHSLR